MEVTGCFETHITLEAPDLERVWAFAACHGLKATHIILGNGQHPSQPMLTGRADGKLSEVLGKLQTMSNSLHGLGASVLRIKVETTPDNPAAPIDDGGAAERPAEWHFEHHVKLLLGPKSSIALIESIAERHFARLSRNAFKDDGGGHQERFLTQRFYRAGRVSAALSLNHLLAELSNHQIDVLESEAEYVVYDSNARLDSGWINQDRTT